MTFPTLSYPKPMRLFPVLATLAVLLPLHAQDAPFFFLQLADTQFGMYTKDQNFEQETANAAFAVATANRLRPRFVIVCGDLVNKPNDKAQGDEYFRVFKELRSGVRLYAVAGNHDVGNVPTPDLLRAYRERFGRDWYSFDEGPLRGIVLNSSLIHSPQSAVGDLEAQEKWLTTELEKAKRDRVRHLVVFQHHPYFLERPDEEDSYFAIPKERRLRYLRLFRESGVTHVFAGHYHRNSFGRDDTLEMVTTGPVGMPLGGTQSGLRVVVVRVSGIEHRFFPLGMLPNAVDPAVPLGGNR